MWLAKLMAMDALNPTIFFLAHFIVSDSSCPRLLLQRSLSRASLSSWPNFPTPRTPKIPEGNCELSWVLFPFHGKPGTPPEPALLLAAAFSHPPNSFEKPVIALFGA